MLNDSTEEFSNKENVEDNSDENNNVEDLPYSHLVYRTRKFDRSNGSYAFIHGDQLTYTTKVTSVTF